MGKEKLVFNQKAAAKVQWQVEQMIYKGRADQTF
jgi:hypothetical protein